jgi:hypothetical protein
MASIFPNSDKHRQQTKRASLARRLAREVGSSATARSPQIQRVKHELQDLLRVAQRSGDLKKVTELRAIMQRLLGNVTARIARQMLDKALASPNPVARALRRVNKTAGGDFAKDIKRDMDAVKRLIAALDNPATGTPPPQRRIAQPTEHRRDSGAPMPANAYLQPDGSVRIKTGTFNRQYKLTDPTVTGKMIPVQSSNVHSIGFAFNYKHPLRSTLYVRFLGTDSAGKRSGSGPLYEYFDIHPDKFQQMRKASSKGGWVWDELRVRGSAVQHQVRYSLKAIVDNYLPRQATVRNGREMFVKRTRQPRAKTGEQAPPPITSPLPNQDLGPVRGRPNRGRPKRGR